MGIVVPLIVYAVSKGFRAYIEAIWLRPLTVFHIWRFGAALLFFWYGAHDLLPQITNAGGIRQLLRLHWCCRKLPDATGSILALWLGGRSATAVACWESFLNRRFEKLPILTSVNGKRFRL
jgi:hypothetical protein